MYMDIPPDYADWTGDVRSPWPVLVGEDENEDLRAHVALPAVARRCITPVTDDPSVSQDCLVVWDEPIIATGNDSSRRFKVVVVGKQTMESATDDQRHFVLVVSKREGEAAAYERVGAGFMAQRCIDWNCPGLEIEVW